MLIDDSWDFESDVPLLPYRKLAAGSLTCLYEAGNLRRIKYADTEIVRMIYGAVRDENWNTIIPLVTDEMITEDVKGIAIHYTANYKASGIDYKASFEIKFSSDNRVEFSMKGIALNSFKKNRIGICVLHPLKSCTGNQLQIVEPDGNSYNAKFPGFISPHQPFKNIQQMHWQTADKINASVYFEGEVFETEDQRNWGDSSYKTYGTPLEIPYPALLQAGETMEQKIVLTVTGNLNSNIVVSKENHIIQERKAETKIGFIYGPDFKGLEEVFNRPVHHLRVEFFLYEKDWMDKLLNAMDAAQSTNTQLELILFFDDDYNDQLAALLLGIKPFSTLIYSMLLLDRRIKITPGYLMKNSYESIKYLYPSIKAGYGTEANFALLNRFPPGDLPCDFVSFGLMPQVHASDIRTIIENLECLPDIINSIRSFTDKEIHISPLSLHKIKNHDAVSEEEGKLEEDPLKNTQFAAWWIKNAISQLGGAALISIPPYQSLVSS